MEQTARTHLLRGKISAAIIAGIAAALFAVFVPLAGAENKVGVNIAARHEEFEQAAELAGKGGWVVIMASNANKLQELINKHRTSWDNTNIILRGHCPSDPLGPDVETNKLFALSWAATLGSLDLRNKRIYFMPWNEPNMTRECGNLGDDTDPNNTECAPYVQRYIADLRQYLSDPQMGNIGGKVALLSPMLNQHHANFDAFVAALGPGFFRQFEGISMNLYDNETCGGPLCQTDAHFNAGKFATILNMLSTNLPAFGVETGLIDKSGTCPAGVTDCPLFEDDKMEAFFRAAWGFAWRDSGKLKMFSPLSYNPETNAASWIYGSDTADYLRSLHGPGSVAAASGFNSAQFQAWLQQALAKADGAEGKLYKCSGLENSYAADPGMCNFCAASKKTVAGCKGRIGQRDELGAENDTECLRDVSGPWQIAFDVRNGSSKSIQEATFCEFIGKIPLVGRSLRTILCRWREVGKDAKSLYVTRALFEQPAPPGTEAVVQGVGGVLRRLVGKEVSEPKGLLRKFLPADLAPPPGADPLTVHNKVVQLGTPYKLWRKQAGGGSGGGSNGGGSGGGSGGGRCEVPEQGECAVGRMEAFGENARNASMVCFAESGGDTEALNAGCLDGSSPDYSVGLFQINLLAYCPGAFADFTRKPPSCKVADWDKLEKCKEKFFDPAENISKAVELSQGGTNWSQHWGRAAQLCGLE